MCMSTTLNNNTKHVKLHVEGSNETVRVRGLPAEVDMQVVTSLNHIIRLWVFLLQEDDVFIHLPLCSPVQQRV